MFHHRNALQRSTKTARLVEHLLYSQLVYCLERIPAVVERKSELKDVEPFKTVLTGDLEAIAKFSLPDFE